MYVHVCKWPLFHLCSIAGVDQIIIENEQLLTEKYVQLASAFFIWLCTYGNWYPGHITDNGVPLFLTNSPKNYAHSCSQDNDCVLYTKYAAKSFVSEVHLIHSYINYTACMALYEITSTVFLSSRGELSREVDELMIKLRDTEKYV